MVKLDDIVSGYAQHLEEQEQEEEFSNISEFVKKKIQEEKEAKSEEFFNIEKMKTICKSNWMIAIILAVILYMVSRI